MFSFFCITFKNSKYALRIIVIWFLHPVVLNGTIGSKYPRTVLDSFHLYVGKIKPS